MVNLLHDFAARHTVTPAPGAPVAFEGHGARIVIDAAEGTELYPRRKRRDWKRAVACVRQLLANRHNTRLVFEIQSALEGSAPADGYQRLLSTAEGGRIAFERIEFAQKLMDQAWLETLPSDSVGAAYLGYVRSEALSATEFSERSQEGNPEIEVPHPYAWFNRRTRDVHDVWHVLTGYGRDALGETAIIAFTYAQTRSLGLCLIAAGAALRARNSDKRFVRAVWEGYRNGKSAAWLLGEDYEQLMREPLASARRRLRIAPPSIYLTLPSEQRNSMFERRRATPRTEAA